MRTAALFSCLLIASVITGCAMTRNAASQHPGITEPTPNAINRTFPASATLVAQRLADIMGQEEILENVAMTPDTASKEYRNFSRADRQALGISMLTPANDVNYNIKAKCKDGSPVAVTVRLKGESSAEVSVLYGFGGEPDLSRDLLNKLQTAVTAPSPDTAVAKAGGSNAANSKPLTR